MKVILNCHVPFMLAHGGAQIQIEQTQAALQQIGVAVEPLRWYDDSQTGDVLHHFGRIPTILLHLAHQKGMKVVVADLLTEQGSRSASRLWLQRTVSRAMRRTLPPMFTAAYEWDAYRLADACVALTGWEAHLMTYLFEAPRDKVFVVPNGVEEVFLNSQPAQRGKWLVCTATITWRKRVLELAEAAVQAQTPLWIIGKAYSDKDPYAQRFLDLAKQNSSIVRYEGAIGERARLARIYREARGFVLLSAMESLSLSALEAAACECPLLLSDLPWARTVFGQQALYCSLTGGTARAAACLRGFYDSAPVAKPPPKPATWPQVAAQLKAVYEHCTGGQTLPRI